MPTEVQGVGTFPASDHFPLGRPFGAVDTSDERPSHARPFGLTLAVRPRVSTSLETDRLGYDSDRQIGLIREGDDMVPLAKHTDGQTNTQTNADGQHGPDSDTDARED
ncbi:putative ATP-grasp-modified RiPP [Amycolatopsis sp. cmx-11-51]|uniref:putative ATP-grasp-modified RiPP n=1 Tax=Amycolatopsis sp. cmx-11-51 TaxID=2785797 RepID=UPI0039E50B83